MAVFKKNDAWWIDCYLNGQRVRRKVGPDKRTAVLVEKDLKVRAAKGEWLGVQQVKRVTFEAFTKEFLSKQAGKAKSTVGNYEVACRLHFNPAFGSRYLTEIRPKHIEDFKQARAKVASFNTVNLELVLLGAIFNSAVTWGYLRENPVKLVKPLRVPEKEPPYMTRDEASRLYEKCEGYIHTFVSIALNTGMRLSEIAALTWADLDMRHRVIKVRNDEEFTTKGRRNRVLPINDFLFGVLEKAPRHISSQYVIFDEDGKRLGSGAIRQRFRTALKRASLPGFRIHDLRHTFGTLLAADGVDVVTIQKLMGHREVTTTMKYLHAAPDRMRWAVENLHLDGSTQAEVEAAERRKRHQGEAITQTSGA